MSSLNPTPAWDGHGHPPLELLRQYHEDALPNALRHRLERHLLACALCADVAEGMSRTDRMQTEAAVMDITRRITTSQTPAKNLNKPTLWADWRAAAAVVVLLLSGVVVLYFQFTKVMSGELATLPAPAEQQEIRSSEPPVLKSAEPVVEVAEEKPSQTDPVSPSPVAKSTRSAMTQTKTPAVILKEDEATYAVANEVTVTRQVPTELAEDAVHLQEGAPSIILEGPAPAPVQRQAENAIQGRVAGVAVSKARNQQMSAPLSKSQAVRGRVVSETGEGLPGVAVVVKGKGMGASTDAYGNFSLTLPEPQETLVINYIGYITQEQPVTKETQEVQVRLVPDESALNEVVVTGYGTQRREAVGNMAAAPVGGLPAFKKYLEQQLRYPEAARQAKVQGRVVVGFTVQPDGQLHDLRLLKSLHPAADAEALRLVREGPAWQPAEKNGKKVPEEVKVTVRFKL